MEYGCKNKVVVISGGTSGIGLAAARAFWLDGAGVSIIGRDSNRGMKALAEIAGCENPETAVFPGLPERETTISAADGPDRVIPGTAEELARLRYIRADVTKPGDCRMAAAIAAYYGAGRIDILVNSAGIYQEKRIENVSAADYNRIMDVNLKGVLFMIQACQPYLLSCVEGKKDTAGGDVSSKPARGNRDCLAAACDRCIINMASDAGLGGNYGCPVYCASKGALSAAARALDAELSPKGISVAALEPRYVLTRMFRDCAGRMGVPEAAALSPESFACELMDRLSERLKV